MYESDVVPNVRSLYFKGDDYFYKILKRLIREGNTTLENSPDVRPVLKNSREPAHTIFITNVFEEYDISKNEFPITMARPISVMSGIKEMLWVYQDQSNCLELLKDKYGVTWWDDWDNGDRTIGQRYGAVVKKYDMINKLIETLKTSPNDRRMYLDINQLTDLQQLAKLDACAFMTTWNVRKGEYIDMCLTIRSNDYLVAGHIDRMQYVALMMMIAQCTGYKPGVFSVITNNLHVYHNQLDQLSVIMDREAAVNEYIEESHSKSIQEIHSIYDYVPVLKLNPDITDFYAFTPEDFKMVNYNPIRPQLDAFELAI